MGPRTRWLGTLLEYVWTVLPAPAARFVTLAVLWLILRPTSLIRVMTSALAHRMGGGAQNLK